MPRRGRPGSINDLLPDDMVPWAREVWRDRYDVAMLDSGAWMLRTAADVLGIDQREVDKVLKHSG